MHKVITLVLIAILTSVGLFGSVFMDHGSGGCIIATSQAVDCPAQTAPLDYLGFHTGVLQQLSQAGGFDLILSYLLIATISLLLYFLGAWLGVSLLTSTHKRWASRGNHPPPITSAQRIINWLRRLDKSGLSRISVLA